MNIQTEFVETAVSVLAAKFAQPIADLSSRLVTHVYLKPDRVSATFRECGYSASALILVAAMVESAVQRDKYIDATLAKQHMSQRSVADYLHERLGYRRFRRVEELFETRNAIAHNHIWEIDYTWNESRREHKESKVVAKSHRLKTRIPRTARIPRTPIVRFNLQPSRIDRTDLIKALTVATDVLEFLAKHGTNPVNIARHSVAFGKRRIQFGDLVAEIQHEL